MLPLTAVFHLAMTAWAFSNPDILSKQGSGAVESSAMFADMSLKAGESKGFFQALLVQRFSNCVAAVYFPFVMMFIIIIALVVHKLFLQNVMRVVNKCRGKHADDAAFEDLPRYTESLPLDYLETKKHDHENGVVVLEPQVYERVTEAIKTRNEQLQRVQNEKALPEEKRFKLRLMNANSPVDYNMSSNNAYRFMASGDMEVLKTKLQEHKAEVAAQIAAVAGKSKAGPRKCFGKR
jgi:hypothetical protein